MAIVVGSTRAASAVPVQGDDLFNLFVIEHERSNPWVATWSRFWDQLEGWRTGNTDHFSPLGSALEIWLKRWMVEQPFGLSMHRVDRLAFVAAAVLSFVAVTLLVRGVVGSTASSCAVPVALGWAAAAQVTTVWSTYDPLVVHATFGVWVTAAGWWFMVAVHQLVARPARRRWRVAATALGLAGASLYVGFTVFVVAAAAMVWWPMRALRRGERLRAQRVALLWGVLPAGGLLFVTRVVSAVVSTSEYEGTSLSPGFTSISATTTGTLTMVPTANWGRALQVTRSADVHIGVPSVAWLVVLVAAAGAWWWFQGRHATTPSGHRVAGQSGSGSVAVAFAAVLIGSVVLFAFTGLWGPYLSVPGNTYMGTASVFWVWAAMIAVGLRRAADRSPRWAGAAAAAVVLVAAVQWSINDAVVEVERRSPTPFGVDLVGLIDSGALTDEGARCEVLRGIPLVASLDGWHDRLNAAYSARHGEPFCAVVAPP